MTGDKRILRCVDPYDNHNKEYIMERSKGVIRVRYGRVGRTYQSHTYNDSYEKWEELYQSKLDKGYKDVTDNYSNSVAAAVDTGDPTVDRLIDKLLSWSNSYVKRYTSVSTLNQDAIDEGQALINRLVQCMTKSHGVSEFNAILPKRFTIIPRSTLNVYSLLANSSDDYAAIITREQDILDAISANAGTIVNDKNKIDLTGYNFRSCSDKELAMIKDHLDPNTRLHFSTAVHVECEDSRKRYEEYKRQHSIKKEMFLYHGSRNENYWSIVRNGLMLRPTTNVSRSGSMFGHGLYFANKARKSAGYTSLSGSFWANGSSPDAALLLFKVATGKSKNLYSFNSVVSRWKEADCRKAGYDSVYAHASNNPSLHSGRLYNDEIIVYNDNACTLSYIIYLKG